MDVALHGWDCTHAQVPPPVNYYVYSALNYLTHNRRCDMSWDTTTENAGFWIEVASHRMARRALQVEIKSLNKMMEDDTIAEWLPFLPEKALTKSLKRDIATISAKVAYDRAKTTTSNQSNPEKGYSKTQPSS